MSLYKKDVIVALATPKGIGAISLVRISGSSLSSFFYALSKITAPKSRHVYNVNLKSKEEGRVLDNVLMTYYKSPNSFTGEDVIEISCHGGNVVSKRIIDDLLFSGCRYGDPGEFSKRAFLNGKIDLIQAESINKIISSKSTEEVNLGLMGLEGTTKLKLEKIKTLLVDLITLIEHELDFVELEIIATKQASLKKNIKKIIGELDEIIIGSLAGKKLHDGIRVSIVGPPNAGKSTLFNSLLGHNRALVSSEKGTTRDAIEAFIELEGAPIILVDTAGYWKGKNKLDRLGIEKTKKELLESDVVIALDEKNPLEFIKRLTMNLKNVIFVLSKSDINNVKNIRGCLKISSLKNKSIKKLLTDLSTLIKKGFFPENRIAHSHRQLGLIKNAKRALLLAYEQFDLNDLVQTVSLLRGSLDEIREVVGEVYNEEILNNIFSDFCVGK